jgi:hypothetical protein
MEGKLRTVSSAAWSRIGCAEGETILTSLIIPVGWTTISMYTVPASPCWRAARGYRRASRMRWRTRPRYARYSASVLSPPPPGVEARVPALDGRASPAPVPARAVTVGGGEGADADSLLPDGLGVADVGAPTGAGESRSTIAAGGLAKTASTVGTGCRGGSATCGIGSGAATGGGGAGETGCTAGGWAGGGSGNRGVGFGVSVASGAGEGNGLGSAGAWSRAEDGAGGPLSRLADSVGCGWTWATSGRSLRSMTKTS